MLINLNESELAIWIRLNTTVHLKATCSSTSFLGFLLSSFCWLVDMMDVLCGQVSASGQACWSRLESRPNPSQQSHSCPWNRSKHVDGHSRTHSQRTCNSNFRHSMFYFSTSSSSSPSSSLTFSNLACLCPSHVCCEKKLQCAWLAEWHGPSQCAGTSQNTPSMIATGIGAKSSHCWKPRCDKPLSLPFNLVLASSAWARVLNWTKPLFIPTGQDHFLHSWTFLNQKASNATGLPRSRWWSVLTQLMQVRNKAGC